MVVVDTNGTVVAVRNVDAAVVVVVRARVVVVVVVDVVVVVGSAAHWAHNVTLALAAATALAVNADPPDDAANQP